MKISTHKRMPQRLPIALAQIKGVNTAENLLNEIRRFIHSLYSKKRIKLSILKKRITLETLKPIF